MQTSMSRKKRTLLGSAGVVVVVLILLAVFGVFYAGFKKPSQQVRVATVACSLQDQKDFTQAAASANDTTDYRNKVQPIAAKVAKQPGYLQDTSCAYIVFAYDVSKNDIKGAQAIEQAVSANLPTSNAYNADQALYLQMQSQLSTVSSN